MDKEEEIKDYLRHIILMYEDYNPHDDAGHIAYIMYSLAKDAIKIIK